MKKLNQIKKNIKNLKDILKKKYKVKNIGIFGSYVKNKAKKGSDVDILVEFEEPIGLFEFIELENFLGKKIGIKVDLVTKKALKPTIGKRIFKEVSYL
jgi:hypothetical protein